jgi:hypothetical protein
MLKSASHISACVAVTTMALSVFGEFGSAMAQPIDTSASGAGCTVHEAGSSSINGLFADVPGFAVKQGCPPGMPSPFAGVSVKDVSAATLSQNGGSILAAYAAELTTDGGEAFAKSYVADMARGVTDPNRAVSSDTEVLGGQQVTHYYNPDLGEGYVYGRGPTVVIARTAPGSHANDAKTAFAEIVAKLG